MNINTLINDVAEALAADSDLGQWCVQQYEQQHKVYINVNERNLPAEADCPYVAVFPMSKMVGYEIDTKNHVIGVTCCIHDDDSKVREESNIVEYEGVQRLETFRKYVETAIAGVTLSDAQIHSIEVDFETIEAFPFMMAWMGVSINEEWAMGDDALL